MSLHAEGEAIVHELFNTEDGRRDPYPRLHRLRQVSPVHRSETIHAWVLTRYDDCRTALKDPRFGKRFAELLDRAVRDWREQEALASFSRMMVQLDAPEHTRLRKRVARAFTAKMVEGLRPQVVATVAELIEQSQQPDTEDGDLLEQLAFTLPITVIGDLLGIERDDLVAFRQPTLDFTAGLELRPTEDAKAKATKASRFFDGYFTDLVARRRETPGPDLLSALVVDDDDDPLDVQELLDLAKLLLMAGFETTTNVISGGLLALHDQPEQLAILRAALTTRAPAEGMTLDHVADEFLRHQASLQFANRVALEDVEVGGKVIPAGETVFVMLGAANRDPAVFEDPDRLDFTRPRPKHLTFGGGIHHCLGAALARLELEVLLEQLAARFTSVDLAGERPRFRDTLAFRATESLPVTLAPVPGGACPVSQLGQRVALLETHPLFSACRPSELADLATNAVVRTFEAGEALVEQGERSDETYVLMEGEVGVSIDGSVVATLGVDALVGERGAVTETPRAATVTATSHVAALVIPLDRLRAVLDANPVAAATMTAVTAARYRGASDRVS